MNNLIIATICIVAILLIAISLYMVKKRFVFSNKTYDAMAWTVSMLILIAPFIIAICEACDLNHTPLIATIISGLVALLEKMVEKSKANYKTISEDGDEEEVDDYEISGDNEYEEDGEYNAEIGGENDAVREE